MNATANGPSSADARHSYFIYDDDYSIASAGTRTVLRRMQVPEFKWFCEREGCGWSGHGFESVASAQRGAEDHQQRSHPRDRDRACPCGQLHCGHVTRDTDRPGGDR